jgi:deoxyribodipyrimidine photo-lyase
MIGDGSDANYPYPVVDFEREATAAREQFSRLADEAQAALDDLEIRRRASLSRDRRQRMGKAGENTEGEEAEEIRESGKQRQGRLAEF